MNRAVQRPGANQGVTENINGEDNPTLKFALVQSSASSPFRSAIRG